MSRRKKNSNKTVDYGLKSNGKIRVFSKERKSKKGKNFVNVWTNISKKIDDETYINQSIPLKFGKDDELPEHNSIIDVIDSFFIVESIDTDYQKVGLFIKDWEYAEE